jgi:hypothetical protein
MSDAVSLSKSQRHRRRRQARQAEAERVPLTGAAFRLGTVVAGGQRLSPVLGATRTWERLHPASWLRDPGLPEERRLEKLISRVLRPDLGTGGPDSALGREAEAALRGSGEFKARSLRFLTRLRQVNLRAMLDHHCPRGPSPLPCDPQQVLALLRAVLHRAGLSALLAVPDAAVTRALTMLLGLTKGGHLTLAELLHLLPAPRALLPWLVGWPKVVRTHLGARLAVWGLVTLPRTLLSALFIVTDTSHGKHQLFYYRQSVWQAMAAQALHGLTRKGHVRTGPAVFLAPRDRSLPARPPPPAIRPMRFIPKRNMTRLRPISMRCPAGAADHDPALTRDSPMRGLVRQLVRLRPATCDLKGKRLAREWARLGRAAPPGTPLYWATADIKDAFGSVLHGKLTSILTQETKSLGCFPNGRTLANQVCYRVVRHIVSFREGRRVRYFHLQGRGLVQGDPFSPDLSSLYYGHLTAARLAAFLRPPAGHSELLLRAADDFLFVSTSRDRVWDFQRATVGASFPEYGAKFEKDKFVTNVETGDQGTPAVFCGALLHMDSRDVTPFYSPDLVVLAAMRPRDPGTKARPTIAAKFLRLVTVHMTGLYLGPHNSRGALLATLATNLAIALRRLTALLTAMIWSQGRRVEERWLWTQVLMPGFAKVSGLMKRTGLPKAEVRLVALLRLQAALAACPHFSPGLRRGVAATLRRGRGRVGEARSRHITRTVWESSTGRAPGC